MSGKELYNSLFTDGNGTPELSRLGRMSALSAVETLLSDVGTPLNCEEMARLIIKRGLWETESETPEAIIRKQLAVDIQKYGDKSRFQRIKPSVYGLRSWGLSESPRPGFRENERIKRKRERLKAKILRMPEDERRAILSAILDIPRQAPMSLPELPSQIHHHNKTVQKKLRDRLYELLPTEFEVLISKLLIALGFDDVIVTGRSGDGGIDVRGTLVVGEVIRTRMAVQVKRWRNKNIQAPIVQQMRGSLGTHDQDLIITASDFSSGARAEAERADATPVALMNGEQLVRLLIQNNIGIRRTPYDLIELSEDEDV
jgi:restriction system protein